MRKYDAGIFLQYIRRAVLHRLDVHVAIPRWMVCHSFRVAPNTSLLPAVWYSLRRSTQVTELTPPLGNRKSRFKIHGWAAKPTSTATRPYLMPRKCTKRWKCLNSRSKCAAFSRLAVRRRTASYFLPFLPLFVLSALRTCFGLH